MKRIILFDGECFLCNSFINFVIENNNFNFYFLDQRSQKFSFYQKKFRLDDTLNTIYLIEDNKVYSKSKAIKLILKRCGILGYIIFLFLQILPKFLSDYIYQLISKNRFFIFKKKCVIPNKKIKSRTI
ncbi:thiol-disulfide oxidoreductase DCC family protein [uncultured Polaribacter sp.]|uniref:thiol-disulfide oxidoreductase DCC family protein n=1 Tax=uncultured Polaribacter sp. TaxID=174711 RepID=UPI00345C55DB